MNGCPKVVYPDYMGYTGAKNHKFPTLPASKDAFYPDITADYEKFKLETLAYIRKIEKKPFGYIRVMKKFLENFSTGEKWDMKFQPQFPGRDILGRNQYAKYKNKIVVGNYISNNLYGFLCAAIGIPERLSKFIGRLYSHGILEPIIQGKIPSKKLLKFKDPISDQQAISSGYRDFFQFIQKS